MDRIKVLIADDILETRSVIKKMLSMEEETFSIVGEASNGMEVVELIPRLNPDVVLMDINMPILNGLEATEKITNEFPNISVIIMSVQGENEYLKKAMFCGAKEYIIKPFNYDSLVETIKSTHEKNRERLNKLGHSREEVKNADILTFFSTKGGVGKSILALNAAVISSCHLQKKTLLIDMDLQFGDISILVNKHNEKNISNLIEDAKFDSYENTLPYLYKYDEKLDILFAPLKPDAAEYIGKDIIEKLINIYKCKYERIIIDTGVNFSDITLYILDISSRIYFISNMDIVSLKNAKLGLNVMQSLGYDKNKVKLIINKSTMDYGINRKDVLEVFKENDFYMIPEDHKTVNISVNSGEPFCKVNKYYKSKIGKAMQDTFKDI